MTMVGGFLPLLLLAVLDQASQANGWCVGIGRNPVFTATPRISQEGLGAVQISWSGMVEDLDCADNFLVSYWVRGQPHKYELTPFMSPKATGVTISDLSTNVPYVFQVIARENKGKCFQCQ